MKIVSAGLSDTGRTRTNNEDAFVAESELQLFAVADGMGGYAAGEVASQSSIDALQQGVVERFDDLVRLDTEGESWRVQSLLEQAVQEACGHVNALANENTDYKGMGTTMSAMWLSPHRATIAHVGDSRVYLVRKGECHPLTEDHSLVRELLRQGRLTDAEAKTFPYPNALTRALGPNPVVEVDTLDLELCAGDRFLLCSDGLHRYLEKDSVAAAVSDGTPEQVVERLVKHANGAGGVDNITALVVEVSELPSTGVEVQKKVEFFRGMPLFRYLTYKELMLVLGATTMRHYHPEQVIFQERTMGYELFVILTGKVRLQNRDTVLAELGPGGHFGEMALVDQERRSATAIATDSASLLVLPRKKFYSLLRKEPPLAVKLLWNFLQVLSGRLRQANISLQTVREDFLPDATQTNPLFKQES